MPRFRVELVQACQKVLAQLRFGGRRVDGIGMEFDDGSAGALHPLPTFVLEQVVQRNVVERTDASSTRSTLHLWWRDGK